MKIPQLPQDKANHFVYGAVIGNLVKHWAQAHPDPRASIWAVSLGIVAGIAAAKELSDAWLNKRATGNWRGVPAGTPHGVEFKDWLATVAGAAVVIFS